MTYVALRSLACAGARGRLLLVFATFLLATMAAADEKHRQIFQVDDLFRFERLEDVTLSPDGQAVALARYLPRREQGLPDAPPQADIWVAGFDGRAPMNVTNGGGQGRNWGNPQWSPDGAHLAMLSSSGDGAAHLWVWEKASRKLRQVSDRPVVRPFAWLDRERLVVRFAPEQPPSLFPGAEDSHHAIALRAMQKSVMDREPSVSVLDSGVPMDFSREGREEVALLHLDSTILRVLKVPANPSYDGTIHASPDAEHVAYLEFMDRPAPPALAKSPEWGWFAYLRLTVFNRAGDIAITDTRLSDRRSFRWSMDGQSFAFIVRNIDDHATTHLVRGSLGGKIEVVPLPGIEVRDFRWAAGNRLLVKGERKVPTDVRSPTRTDWWLLRGEGPARNLTASLEAAPGAVRIAGENGRYAVWAAGGDLWRLAVDSGELTNLSSDFKPDIASIAGTAERPSEHPQSVVVQSKGGASGGYYRVNVDTGAMSAVLQCEDCANLLAFNEQSDVAILASPWQRSGSVFVARKGRQRPLMEVNGFVQDIVAAGTRKIEYRSLEGQDLKGWLLLPVNYQSGRRYPLIVWVYAGQMFNDEPPDITRVDFFHAVMRPQLWAARDYAVLLPSMPRGRPIEEGGSPAEPLLELTNGVMPAIDKAIDLGFADPQRLAVLGHSYGGFSTYGLVTQTKRFKAAIALAGISDWISYHGIISMPVNYSPSPELTKWWQTEAGQPAFGSPPWRDTGRYLRNSPIFYMDRVETPVLIVQGDNDHVSITQGEEFFSGLYREGKRARFLRYWGESHSVGRPTNVRHLWSQMYAWLDEYCDIARDPQGAMIFAGTAPKGRNEAPPPKGH